MRNDFDSSLIRNNCIDSMFGALLSYRIRTHRSDTKRHYADRSTNSGSTEHISLACDMTSVMSLQVSFDNLTLLPGIMDCGRGHGNAHGGDAEGQRQGEPRDRGASCGASDKARVMLPFSLKLFGGEGSTFLVVRLEVERHLGWFSTPLGLWDDKREIVEEKGGLGGETPRALE